MDLRYLNEHPANFHARAGQPSTPSPLPSPSPLLDVALGKTLISLKPRWLRRLLRQARRAGQGSPLRASQSTLSCVPGCFLNLALTITILFFLEGRGRFFSAGFKPTET